jgi:hypothetical protein
MFGWKDVAKGAKFLAWNGLKFVPGVGQGIMAYEAGETVVAVANKVGELSERKIHVANNCSVPITLVVAPNRNWVFADVGAAIASLVVSFGSSAPAGLAALKGAKSLWDIYNATRQYRAIAGLATTLWGFFSKKGSVIEPGKFECANKRSNSNPLDYLSPSQYGAIFKASDFTMYILAKDGRSMLFNTNSDTSWIVDDAGARPAEYGKIWQANASQPVKAWNA